MSWFDKLFGDDNGSNDDLLRKNKNRRQSQQTKQNNQDSLLPQNNDIYSRPRGKFRFPIQVSENEYTQKNENYNEHNQEETNDIMRSYNQHDNPEFDSSGKRHRRRRQAYSKHDQSKITQKSNLQITIIQIITVFLIKTTIRNLHNNVNQYNLKISKTKQTLRIRRHLLNLHI